MPAKFTSSAKAVFVEAVRRARAGGTNQLREDDLFAALLEGPADSQLQRRYPSAGLPPPPASEGLGPMMANGLESAFAHAS